MRFILAATCIAISTSATAQERPSLGDDPFISQTLVAGRIADRIRKTCPTISARMFVAYGKIEEMKARARELGYSKAEVTSFTKDPQEKARIRAAAEAWLANAGAIEGDAESFCRVGRTEIGRKSLIGSVLK